MGNFKSGELALLLGAAYPEDILAVVGYVPSGVVWQGPSFLQSVSRPRSSWSRGGDPFHSSGFATPHFSEIVSIIGLFAGRPMSFRPLYERSLYNDDAVTAGSIAVEKIEGLCC